jgi:hypothetical protein
MVKNNKVVLIVLCFLILVVSMVSLTVAREVGKYSGKLTVTSQGGNIVIQGPGGVPNHYCGNNVLETYLAEQCDGSDLGGASCESLGFDAGTLSCKAECIYDTSDCRYEEDDGGSSGSSGSSSGSSGSSGIISLFQQPKEKCVEEWECGEWSKCVRGKQTRRCKDTSRCRTTKLKPEETRECDGETIKITNLSDKNENFNSLSGITGSFFRTMGTGWSVLIIISIIIAVVFVVLIIMYARR